MPVSNTGIFAPMFKEPTNIEPNMVAEFTIAGSSRG
jgi:hypothetical protein